MRSFLFVLWWNISLDWFSLPPHPTTSRRMSFASYAVKDTRPCIALVTGARSGIGKALANKIAEFPFITTVVAVSRSIKASDEVVASSAKVIPLAADVGTKEGRQLVVDRVRTLCHDNQHQQQQLRYLIHCAGTIDPIKPALDVSPEEMRHAMTVNCEAPYFLSTALYPYMVPFETEGDGQVSGRILHVSSGAAHGAPPVGWSVYGITKAAFFQSFKVLEREFRHLGGKVLVGSFKPGVVDTSMQATIRDAPADSMPIVGNFQGMKDRMEVKPVAKARPPPKGALDSPDNVAMFAEWLLLGTTDEEFCNKDDANEYDIRDASLYSRWIPEENLPKEEEK